jgi:hypothetical protein
MRCQGMPKKCVANAVNTLATLAGSRPYAPLFSTLTDDLGRFNGVEICNRSS